MSLAHTKNEILGLTTFGFHKDEVVAVSEISFYLLSFYLHNISSMFNIRRKISAEGAYFYLSLSISICLSFSVVLTIYVSRRRSSALGVRTR